VTSVNKIEKKQL